MDEKHQLNNWIEYAEHHRKYAKLIQSSNINHRLDDERYYRLREKLHEWLENFQTNPTE